MSELKRYRVSYAHGVIEDKGQIFPANASRPMVLADEHQAELTRLRSVEKAARAVLKQAHDECGLSNEASSLDALRLALDSK